MWINATDRLEENWFVSYLFVDIKLGYNSVFGKKKKIYIAETCKQNDFCACLALQTVSVQRQAGLVCPVKNEPI